jgi:hypothetical protein
MQPHEHRVVVEKQELDEKLVKLRAFCFEPGSPIFHKLAAEDQELLKAQYTFMLQYSDVLERRIKRFQA